MCERLHNFFDWGYTHSCRRLSHWSYSRCWWCDPRAYVHCVETDWCGWVGFAWAVFHVTVSWTGSALQRDSACGCTCNPLHMLGMLSDHLGEGTIHRSCDNDYFCRWIRNAFVGDCENEKVFVEIYGCCWQLSFDCSPPLCLLAVLVGLISQMTCSG